MKNNFCTFYQNNTAYVYIVVLAGKYCFICIKNHLSFFKKRLLDMRGGSGGGGMKGEEERDRERFLVLCFWLDREGRILAAQHLGIGQHNKPFRPFCLLVFIIEPSTSSEEMGNVFTPTEPKESQDEEDFLIEIFNWLINLISTKTGN